MNPIFTTGSLEAYLPALVSLALLCLMVVIQSLLSAPLAFLRNEQAPGMPLQGDHSLLSFRVLRTHANSAESLAPFGLTLLLAISVNASVQWVNGLAMAHVAFRLLFWLIYYSGIGKVAGGPRTLSFVGGLSCNLILIIMVFTTMFY
ncbi:MAPEG family protein [Marinicella sediminis]|uniref:MAPEG family protein n=1 Tax=Marinicella sediminis TaxID=1792834 RepID=A0ABV7J3Z5_9GAMM|nr:MAPEG family protein [Marinicella sediminis]